MDSEQAIAEYLTLVLEENDPVLLAAAVGDIAKARGMTQVAREAGVSRESLNRKDDSLQPAIEKYAFH